jgi:hypothetical protein
MHTRDPKGVGKFSFGGVMPEQQAATQESCPPLSYPQDRPRTSLILEGYLRREELAQQFGLSPRTIDRWEALRKGPRVCIGRTILYEVESVRDWLRSQGQVSVAKRQRESPRAKTTLRSRSQSTTTVNS